MKRRYTTLEERTVGKQAYYLELPEDLTDIHEVFHVSYLCKGLSIYDEMVLLSEVKLDNKLSRRDRK